jgi:undecaprenyl-diphosphatase
LARVLTDPPDQLKAYVMGAAVGLVVTIGCSRVYLGVHWPTDVLAGWAVGAAWAMACWLSLQAWVAWRGEGAPPPRLGQER